jgi:hypothetical protein
MTNCSARHVGWLAVLAGLLIQPCMAAGPDVPGTSGCTLLIGGGGTVTADKAVNSNWLKANGALSRDVLTELSALGYKVRGFVVDTPDADARAHTVGVYIARTGCGKLLQIAHELRTGAKHSSRFAFVITVLHLEPAGAAAPAAGSSGRAVRLADDYSRQYEYAMTAKVRQRLPLGKLARTIAADLDKAGVLSK